MKKYTKKQLLKRREFIEGMTALGVVTAVGPLSSCASSSDSDDGEQTQTVYRFQTKKSAKTCNACKNHQHYKVFLTSDAADQNRAHPGCHCRIVEQHVTESYFSQIESHATNGMIDLRQVFEYS